MGNIYKLAWCLDLMISFQQLLAEEPTTDALTHPGGVPRSGCKQTSWHSGIKRLRDLNSKNRTILEEPGTPQLLEISKAQQLLCRTVLCQRARVDTN